MKRHLPLALFVALLGLLVGLKLYRDMTPSPLVGKPAPQFRLPQLADAGKTFAPQDMLGKVWLLNAWASWCVTCREEHELLVNFARHGALPIVGLNCQEVRGNGDTDVRALSAAEEQQLARSRAAAWLGKHGDPYVLTALDVDGRVGADYGVRGIPETFLVDRAGIIRYKHAGPLTPELIEQKILPLVKELQT